jgi:hypothetical protein
VRTATNCLFDGAFFFFRADRLSAICSYIYSRAFACYWVLPAASWQRAKLNSPQRIRWQLKQNSS